MKRLMNILTVLCGNVIIAFSIAAFLEPTGIISGGTTGVGLFVQEYIGLPVSVTFAVVNVVCFFLGLFFLGKEFAASTLLSSVIFPFILSFFEKMPWIAQLTDDYLLCAIMAGSLTGIGAGIVIRMNASTGGLDIPPLILNKLFGIKVGNVLFIINIVALTLQISFSSSEQILYGIVQVFLTSMVLDKVLMFGTQQAKLLIISPKYDEIKKMFLENDLGVTLIPIETGYTGQKSKMVLCAVPSRRLPKIRQKVKDVDATAFIFVDSSTEIMGRGFTLPR